MTAARARMWALLALLVSLAAVALACTLAAAGHGFAGVLVLAALLGAGYSLLDACVSELELIERLLDAERARSTWLGSEVRELRAELDGLLARVGHERAVEREVARERQIADARRVVAIGRLLDRREVEL